VLELQASGGMYTHTDGPDSRVPVGALKIGLIASERRPHVTNSVIGDPRVEDQEWARREGMVAFAGYPLMLEDRLLGVMAMFSRKPLSASALQALGSVETSIALAIENRRSAAALREALRRTRESDRLKSVFLANLGHEIRTPLNIITGFTGLISHRVKGLGDEELRSFLRHVDQASTRLLRTIDGLVDISKIETGSFAVTRVQVDLDPLLDAHLEGFGPLAHEKGIVLGCTREIAGASVLFDLYCLTQAVAHLLDNAIKFTETGAVQLRIGREDGVLYLEVADTGVGMEPEYVSRLFVPFSQEDVGYTRRFQGMGLGLALVRHYLDFNGASISVRSEKGRGSAFRIHFPPEIELPAGGARKALAETRRDLSPAAPAAGATVQSALTPSTKRSTLLIVASDPETRLYYRNLLKARYSVVEASTAAEGRHRLSSGQTFDLILTDTWLRGGEDGLSLTRWIRESLSPDLPIVALTIHASGDERQNAIDAGCDAYVSKPINVEKLLSLIESLLDADRARGAARGQTS
jgi:signal transduction histidine kinase/ActR/RegA family two-component response regulator